jgi:hypothetical protein
MEILLIFVILSIIFFMLKFCRLLHTKFNSQNRKRKIDKLEKKYNSRNIRNKRINIFDILEIARYYHIGVDDKYNKNGSLIPGIKPDAKKAIKYYTIAGKLGYKKAYYEIGMIYENGCGDYNGSLNTALEYYKFIYQKGYIRNTEIINKIKVLENALYTGNTQIIDSNIRDDIVPITTKSNNIAIIANAPQLDIDFNQELEDAIIRATQEMTAPAPVIGNMYSDAQNTHDTTLNSTIRDALKKIEPTLQNINANSINEIEEFINSNLHNDKKRNALLTLEKIKQNSNMVSSLGKTEQEVANIVWSRINHADNAEYTQQLKENFCDYLAESVENKKVCCPTGRVNRMVDSLNTVDALVTLKSTSMINQELMNKAGVIRNRLYDELSDDDRKKVDSIETSDVATSFADNTKNAIIKMVNDEYVRTGILNEETATKLTSQWIDAI